MLPIRVDRSSGQQCLLPSVLYNLLIVIGLNQSKVSSNSSYTAKKENADRDLVGERRISVSLRRDFGLGTFSFREQTLNSTRRGQSFRATTPPLSDLDDSHH